MRQELKLKSKYYIIFYSIIGLIPFFGSEILSLLFKLTDYQNEVLNQSSILYGALIVSFLCGMHWEKLIYLQKHNLYFLPMIIVVFVWSHHFCLTEICKIYIIIFSLISCLIMDLLVLNKNRTFWFKKMRVFVTFLAVSSYMI